MTRACRLLPALPALLAALACSGAPGTQSTAPRLEDFRDTYAYRAFHQDGRLLLTGTFTFGARDDSTVGGSWSIAWAPGADTTAVVGPQVGEGQLVGTVLRDAVHIALNPGWADNNVDLAAEQRTADRIAGLWSHSTILGPIAQGRFELRR